jgi:hypothetical protein
MKIIGVRRRSIQPEISDRTLFPSRAGQYCKEVWVREINRILKPSTRPNLTGKCVAGLEHFEIPKQVIKILETDAI